MADAGYERINEYDRVTISLASPEDIRSWSYGEVQKPETINYRTYRPERDGLFCERIFGPERDWECSCGKYRGMKHKGIVCDRCGVKVTHSRVRRHRMGHINLAAPVVHIWFFKSVPCRLGNLLGMKATDLQRVIYFQSYIVTDPKNSPLQEQQLLSEEEYREAVQQYGERGFEAKMGAEAIKTLLQKLDLQTMCKELRAELKTTTSQQRRTKIIKQLGEAEALLGSNNRPEWMVLEVIPVIPPDLRPLVLLDSGNFASSDLNDLYRRIINRNNRLKKLLELNAPEVIIRNEKRMLQQAVDALLDNSRCKRPVVGSGNRPLKALTDMIKGKQGRFRENLLGKRVDYSARSVIVVGPELKLSQCGLPKKIALELYQPFIIRRLKEAFDPTLVEGNAIKLHPLVCKGFNADFDGDAMAVHLPLSVEAQVEAKALMMATHNVFSPQNGKPIVTPSQDIVLGCYYLTVNPPETPEKVRTFSSVNEVFMALDAGRAGLHDVVRVRIERAEVVEGHQEPPRPIEGLLETTVGRIVFNNILPEGMPFYNFQLDHGGLNKIILECYERVGRQETIEVLDKIKELGFKSATRAGLSFAISDLKVAPHKDEILRRTEEMVARIYADYREGAITDVERSQRVIDEWNAATEQVAEEMFEQFRNDRRDGKRYLNPVYLMVDSGARGGALQISQIAGMRGLMAKPGGQIIETPIKSNFRQGLSVGEYFSSTHGARKGLADTALKTADSGYLTRRLADVAQNVVITELDCGTKRGITKGPVVRGDKVEVPLRDVIVGRVARDNIVHPVNDEVIVRENQLITEDIARRIEEWDERMKIRVRSPLTCESRNGICAMCYGMDLARKELAELGLAVGIIAAQSIGEPGTQLTMKTFHIGGVAIAGAEETEIVSRREGKVKYENLRVVTDPDGQRVSISRNGEVVVVDEKERPLDRHAVPLGGQVLVEEGESVKEGQKLVQWNAHFTPILAEVAGKVVYEDIVEGKTLKIEEDVHGTRRKVIMEHKGDMHPQVLIEGEDGRILTLYPIPEKAILEVDEGQMVQPGTRLARSLKEVRRSQDITGGLPRVTELFEARKPKNAAAMSEIDGVVTDIERKRGRTVIKVRNPETGYEVDHPVPPGKHLLVSRGDEVKAGQPLVEGPLVLQDILRISGEEALHQYILQEIQNVYRTQDVQIDDKHFEVVIACMTRRRKVKDPGDTSFLPGQLVDKYDFEEANSKAVQEGGQPASADPVLLGITKAALISESFISAASFQNTTRVLTRAALAGYSDRLQGLKENVIVGHLVPSGTGFRQFYRAKVARIEAPETQELEAARETV